MNTILPQQIVDPMKNFVEITAIMGFMVATILVINLNVKAFQGVFKDRIRQFLWLFFIFIPIPPLLMLYVFSLVFKK